MCESRDREPYLWVGGKRAFLLIESVHLCDDVVCKNKQLVTCAIVLLCTTLTHKTSITVKLLGSFTVISLD